MKQATSEQRPYSGAPLSDWLQFSEKVLDLCLHILRTARISDPDFKGIFDPRLIGLAVLCRTRGNYRGAVVLAREGLVTEARTLARSCFENLIWTVGLVQGKDRFVREILDDQARNFKSGASIVRQDADGLDQTTLSMLRQLETKIESIMGERPKAKTINLKDVAGKFLKGAYMHYRQLSADSSHTSFLALKKHIRRHGDNGYSIALNRAGSTEREAAKALDVASNAVMGVCIALTELLGPSEANERLNHLWAEYNSLSDPKGNLVAFR
jgi:hypothetical protein